MHQPALALFSLCAGVVVIGLVLLVERRERLVVGPGDSAGGGELRSRWYVHQLRGVGLARCRATPPGAFCAGHRLLRARWSHGAFWSLGRGQELHTAGHRRPGAPGAGEHSPGGDNLAGKRAGHMCPAPGAQTQQYTLFPYLTVAQNVAANGWSVCWRELLLDEPWSALDGPVRARERYSVSISRSASRCSRVTHDAQDAQALADTVVVVDRGLVLQTGSPAEAFRVLRTLRVADLVGMEARWLRVGSAPCWHRPASCRWGRQLSRCRIVVFSTRSRSGVQLAIPVPHWRSRVLALVAGTRLSMLCAAVHPFEPGELVVSGLRSHPSRSND